MLRYSVLRLLIFFGVVCLLWLLGLRDRGQEWMLLVLSALISMVISYFVLARFREESTQRLQERINTHQLAFNRAKVGMDTQLLIERKGKLPGQMIGRSPWLQSVHVETDSVPGDILPVTLTAAGPNSMTGALLTKVAA